MKRMIAFIMAVLICLSAVFVTGISALAETTELYSVILYKDSTKQEVLMEKHNLREGDAVYITFDPTREGYTFVSWVNAETNEYVTFTNNVIVVGNCSAEYYIDWSINSYKLVYRGYGEIFEEYDVVYGTPAAEMPVPDGVPSRDGYEFIEWSALPETMPAEKTTIVARWRDTNLEAHFYADLGDAEPFLTVPLLYDDPIFEPDVSPEKTGYTFKGWSFDGENVVSEYELGNIGDEDVSIYAVWEANLYNATFLANGGAFADGSDRKVISVAYNSQIVFNEIPVKNYFVFTGWTPEVGIMNNTNGINFRANWLAEDDIFYTVETYVMGTDGRYTSTSRRFSGAVGTTVTADYTINDGFELNRTKSILTGVVTTDCSLTLKVYIDRCLYDFYVNVDGVKTQETYLYGESVIAPPIPEKEGYTFLSWVPSVPETMPACDYTVTATWTFNDSVHTHTEKTVTVNPTCTENGSEYSVCETCGETIGTETVIPALGHTAGDWVVVLEPTYEAQGKKIKKCTVCNETVEEAVIEKLSAPVTDVDPYAPSVKIRNNPGTVTLKYGEKLRVYAETMNIPSGYNLDWSVSGEGVVITKTETNFCEIQSTSDGTAMLTLTVVDANGEPLKNESGEKISDSQNITSKAGIIQKIIAFFKKLLGLDLTIVQAIKNI